MSPLKKGSASLSAKAATLWEPALFPRSSNNRLLKYLGIFALASLLIAAGLISFDYLRTNNRFPDNTYLGNNKTVNISKLTKDEAKQLLRQQDLRSLLAPVLTLTASKESYSYSPEEIGLYIQVDRTIDEAFNTTHTLNYLHGLQQRIKEKMVVAPIRFGIDRALTEQLLHELEPYVNSDAKDAALKLNEDTGGYNILPGRPARKLQVEQTISNFEQAVGRGEDNIPLAFEYSIPPRVTEALLREKPPVHRLSAYTTYYGGHDSPNRIHNIMLMASWVDNTLILPGEEFSLVKKIGDFTEDRGFKEAYVISAGVLVPELGGGACQIGTTLFNAISLADIKVLNRRNHSFYFNIYPLGRDATIYPGQVDFKFLNDTGAPLFIKAVATKKKLSFRVYGTPTGKKVEFSAPQILIQDPTIGFRPSTLKEITTRDLPFKTKIIRTVFDKDGVELQKEEIRSAYKLYGEKTNVPIKRKEGL